MTEPRVFFIAGTDTDVGKTLIATALLHQAKSLGLSTAAVKPVAAGAEQTPAGLRNSDALSLLGECTMPLSYQDINPVVLKEAAAPHLAAQKAGVTLAVSHLLASISKVIEHKADLTLIEGAGGWRVPLNDTETLADLAKALNAPVILVVGLRLGCINHALLTAEAIKQDGLQLAGWVANGIDPTFAGMGDNIESIQARIGAPCLGEVAYMSQTTPSGVSSYIDMGLI